MANQKITDLNAFTTLASGDLLVMVDDPSGAAETKKITIDNFLAAPPALPLGATATPYTAIYLDNSATDGGAAYFNSSSTSFIKSDAAGTTVSFGGFTTIDFEAATAVDFNASALTGISSISGTTISATGTFRMADGTVGAPGLAFTGDLDTGIYYADGNMNFGHSGASLLAVTSTAVICQGYLRLNITDTDGTAEGQMWYDDSENVIKYYNGTAVKTVQTV